MKDRNGYKCFGYFKGSGLYDSKWYAEDFDDYVGIENNLDRKKVIAYIEKLSLAIAFAYERDVFTGEKLECGLYEDGIYSFPSSFLHYYKKYGIGLPEEYADYIRDKI